MYRIVTQPFYKNNKYTVLTLQDIRNIAFQEHFFICSPIENLCTKTLKL